MFFACKAAEPSGNVEMLNFCNNGYNLYHINISILFT